MHVRNVCLVISSGDPASLNIGRRVLEIAGRRFTCGRIEVLVLNIDKLHLHVKSHEELSPEADMVVFLSRHSGTPGFPIITAHVPGNFGEARYGGLPRKVSVAPPLFLKAFIQEAKILTEGTRFEVAMEPTHHGPSLDVPTAFVEIGCSEEEWTDPLAGEIVAKAVMRALKRFLGENFRPAVGIGGPHINHHFTRIQLLSDYALGHIIRNYDLSEVDLPLLRSAFMRSDPKANVALLDWKSIRSSLKDKITLMLEEISVETIKVKKVLK